MRLLIVVDYQYDFMADDGKLTAGVPAQAIEDRIYSKVTEYQEKNDPVIFTLDAHEEADWKNNAHPESNAFPPHCLKGTEGYALYGKIKNLTESAVLVEKRAYCPDLLDEKIKKFIDGADVIEICGVVTDICVFQTVIGLYTYIINNSMNTPIIVDPSACASFNPERAQWALQYMKEVVGVKITE